MSKKIFILGAGGHTKVLLDCLQAQNISVSGIFDVEPNQIGKTILGIPVVGIEEDLLTQYLPSQIQLVNGIGSIGRTSQRQKVFTKFKDAGYEFLNVMHGSVYIGQEVSLGEGVQLMARSTVQPGCRIGQNVILNTHASLDHDCVVGDHVHIAPGVVCCGGVSIGHGTHIGSGAVILQGIRIENNCLVAAGSIVTRDIIAGSQVCGVPAKIME